MLFVVAVILYYLHCNGSESDSKLLAQQQVQDFCESFWWTHQKELIHKNLQLVCEENTDMNSIGNTLSPPLNL